MDNVITTRELALWAKEAGLDFTSLEESDFDKFMGEASGAGVIFGNTGGVMEQLSGLLMLILRVSSHLRKYSSSSQYVVMMDCVSPAWR